MTIDSTLIGEYGHHFMIGDVVVEMQEALVHQATSPDQSWYGHAPGDVIRDRFFLARTHAPHFVEAMEDKDTWLAPLLHVMTLVPPELAGFPEWNRVRRSDVVHIDTVRDDPYTWAVFQVSKYRRRLQQGVAASRQPKLFQSRIRRAVIEAAGNQCVRCHAQTGLVVDHIVPIALGGTNVVTNAMVLCKSCHLEKSRAERKAFGQSLDHALKLRGLPAKTFKSPDQYLQSLSNRAGWSINRDAEL